MVVIAFAVGILQVTGSVAPATDVPLQVGATVRAELGYRIQASLTVGVLPAPYLDVINGAAVSAGAYDDETGDLIKASLKQSLVVRVGGGYRPFRTRGFYLEVDYTSVSLGGDVAQEDLVSLASGADPPDGGGADPQKRNYSVQSSLQMLGSEVGWEWRLRSRPVSIRAAVGFATTVAAKTTVEPEFQPVFPGLVKVFTDESEDYLNGIYLDYVHFPTASVSAGWAF